MRRLEEAGYTCWVAFRDFHDDFKQHMHEGLLHCRFTLALLSRAYVKSEQCAQEWQAALDADKLIVVRVDPVEPQGLLRTRVHTDLYHRGEEAALGELLSHVKKRLRARPIDARPEPLDPYQAPFPDTATSVDLGLDREAAAPASGGEREGSHAFSRRLFLLGLGVLTIASGTGLLWWWRRPPVLETVKQWKAHENIVEDLAFSPDGENLLSGSADGNLDLWRLTTAERIRRFEGHERSVLSVAFSPDGREIASASSDGSARLWRTLSGAEVRRIDGDGRSVRALAYTPEGRALFVASGDFAGKPPLVRLMAAESGEELQRYEGHEDAVGALAVSPSGGRLLTGSDDRTARLWEVSSGETLKVLKGHRGGLSTVAMSPDGRLAVTGSSSVIPRDHGLRLWDLETAEQRDILEGHEGSVHSVLFTEDGHHILSASSDMTVRLWDAGRGVEIHRLKTLEHKARSLALSPIASPGGRDLVVGDLEGIITHARLV